MLGEETKAIVKSYFQDALDNPRRNVYFDTYYCTKSLNHELVEDMLKDVIESEVKSSRGFDNGSQMFQIEDEPVLFDQPKEEHLVVIYSTALRDRDRKDISDLASLRGWLIEGWVPSQIIEGIYHEYTPGDESVNIDRRWDPYWIYQREGEIPDGLSQYYHDNIDEFLEREIEFSLKTPRRLVNQALRMGATDELLERSEISKSVFKYQIPENEKVQSDGGVMAATSDDSVVAGVTVRETHKIAHNSGDVEATFHLLNEIDSRANLRDEFEQLIGKKEFEENPDGSYSLSKFLPSKVLKIVFREKAFDEEASIKLSNLFTVGQDDVEIYGVEKYRDDLVFITESYTSFDNGEYDILFTSEDVDGRANATLYLRPENASVSGLIYIFKKLQAKFDPRVKWDIVRRFPEAEVGQVG